jgi:hypothetical protein
MEVTAAQLETRSEVSWQLVCSNDPGGLGLYTSKLRDTYRREKKKQARLKLNVELPVYVDPGVPANPELDQKPGETGEPSEPSEQSAEPAEPAAEPAEPALID